MKSNKIVLLAAAASMTFAGAAFAQIVPSPGQQVPLTSSPLATPRLPMTTPVPPAEALPQTAPPTLPSADTAATPSSATVATEFKIGTQVKDPAGVVVGTISGTSAAADGSSNVVITNGAVKFALPGASLATATDGYSTTATKAQIDATLAGAKPH